MKDLLELCTKKLHFSFNGKTYIQVDGVVMGNPLGPVIANIFMVELENILVPTLSDVLVKWQRYVDDTIAFVKVGEVNKVLNVLNRYHKDIQFTHELEEDGELPFLDVLLRRQDDNKLRMKVYRKKTSSDIYLHWNSFAPTQWKIGTLEGMFRRAYLICSDETDLEEEIAFLSKIFKDVNGYPRKIIDKCHSKVKNKVTSLRANLSSTEPDRELPEEEAPAEQEVQKQYLVLPYAGEKGERILKKLKRKIPEDIRPKIVYNGTKLSTFFSAKDKIDKLHCSDVVYYYKGSGGRIRDDYTGETRCRLGKRIKEHQGRDKGSAIVKNCVENDIEPPSSDDFTILAKNYADRMKRRIAESLFMKENKSVLNIQQDSYKLQLFQ